MTTATDAKDSEIPVFETHIAQLVQAGLIEAAEKPVLAGELWEQARVRLVGCFDDNFFVDNDAFSQAFDRIHVDLLDLAGMGVLHYQLCIERIIRGFPHCSTPGFLSSCQRAAGENGLSLDAIHTLRAIRLLTIAADLGLVNFISD